MFDNVVEGFLIFVSHVLSACSLGVHLTHILMLTFLIEWLIFPPLRSFQLGTPDFWAEVTTNICQSATISVGGGLSVAVYAQCQLAKLEANLIMYTVIIACRTEC